MLKRNRKESGTVAVVATISMTMLFACGALAVDLGNAFARQRDLQSQADLAALAGAPELGVGNTHSATDPAVIAVADYLNANQPQDDDGHTAVTPAQLVDDADHTRDGDVTERNGEVYFLPGDRMRVVTPLALVQFGLANVIGFDDVSLAASASVRIRSGGSVMPFFAVDGCDYGLQTISDPPSAPSTINVALSGGSDTTNGPDINSVTPATVPLDSTNANPHPTITLNGSGLETTTQVGFFRNDGSPPHTVGIAAQADGDVVFPITPTEVTVTVPEQVLAVEEPWYVRVLVPTGPGPRWSKADADKMGVLNVGASVLECEGAASDGNFGTLKLPRYNPNQPSGWLPRNIAEGLEEPLTLKTHGEAASPWTCSSASTGAKLSDTAPANLVPETNCVDTDTGLPNNVATSGFITGDGTVLGRLDENTTPGCGTDDDDANANDRWDTGISKPGPGNYEINDDLLTCFMVEPTEQLSSITVETYSGAPALKQSIYHSPRFFYMPVLGVEPTSGGSCCYSIIDFRAGFITDQPLTARGDTPTEGASTNNGFVIQSGNVKQVKVIFFNTDALPAPPEDAPEFAYMGSGPKLIRLID